MKDDAKRLLTKKAQRLARRFGFRITPRKRESGEVDLIQQANNAHVLHSVTPSQVIDYLKGAIPPFASAIAVVMVLASSAMAQDAGNQGLANAMSNTANSNGAAAYATGANYTLSLPGVTVDMTHGQYISGYTSQGGLGNPGNGAGSVNSNASVKK